MDLILYQPPAALSADANSTSSACYIVDKDYYAILAIAETSLALLVYTLVLG